VAAFVRILVVLVGMANMFLFSLAGDGDLGRVFILSLDPWWPQNVMYALAAVVAGLLVSSIALRSARRGLEGGAFARYGVMVLAICLGGGVERDVARLRHLVRRERADAAGSGGALPQRPQHLADALDAVHDYVRLGDDLGRALVAPDADAQDIL
jgi:hypothetical protein